MNRIELGPVAIEVAAPPALVFQMLAAIGQGAQTDGERAEIVEERDGELICDFWTSISLPVGRDRLVRTRERVNVRTARPDRLRASRRPGRRPARVDHGRGHGPDGDGTTMTYTGTYHPEGLVDHVRAAFLARPTIERVMRTHFADVRDRAEARAGRSRVFAPEPGA